jgi:hypothetical protein
MVKKTSRRHSIWPSTALKPVQIISTARLANVASDLKFRLMKYEKNTLETLGFSENWSVFTAYYLF